ncbi:hypothetical protein PMG11_01465 [Penicillium brasilianum]|uniref:Uncharacterized protein n=1 Tax=Penicillium brasilianum TaxID=104259 RepID=A0A0F7TI50_PENBI|nr:hypothetical protein PMG11_01465 [Penicillium brasilianum]
MADTTVQTPRKTTDASAEKRSLVRRLAKRSLNLLRRTSNLDQSGVDNMIQALDLAGKENTQTVPRALGELNLEEVHTIFKLTKLTDRNEQPGDRWRLVSLQAIYEPWPEFDEFYDFLMKALTYIDAANNGSQNSEAQIRSRLDQILGLVLGFAKMEGQLITHNEVSWGRETHFRHNVELDSKQVHLTGRPDYALWYGAQADLETNLVIVEAKRQDRLSTAESQLLAYMGKSLILYTESIADLVIGLVHSGRLEREKEDTTVYGISSDSYTFNFYRISETSKWCKKPMIWGQSKAETREIIGYLLTIFHETSTQSPVDPGRSRRQFSSSAGDDEAMDIDNR